MEGALEFVREGFPPLLPSPRLTCMFHAYNLRSIWEHLAKPLGFPDGSVVKNLPAMQETQEIRVRSLSWKDLLEEEMETHSSILACKIPWTEEPGGLQSKGSQRIRYKYKSLAQRSAKDDIQCSEILMWKKVSLNLLLLSYFQLNNIW